MAHTEQRDPPRVFVSSLDTDCVGLSKDQAHYLTRVLRLQAGAPVIAYDGRGGEGEAALEQHLGAGWALRIDARRTQPPASVRLSVAVSPPKGDRADWLVEKLTELGVASIIWLRCERTVVELKDGSKKMTRWQRLARSAAAQARRAALPSIDGPVNWDTLVTHDKPLRLLADPQGKPLLTALPESRQRLDTLVVIGPEGGLTPNERAQAEQAGFQPVKLGAQILRVETAAVAFAAAMLAAAEATSGPSAHQPE